MIMGYGRCYLVFGSAFLSACLCLFGFCSVRLCTLETIPSYCKDLLKSATSLVDACPALLCSIDCIVQSNLSYTNLTIL
ncbi:uncharacterized protein BDV14DRAFT_111296 [Aspergillus stella-maris]|uniref:uncharacterized protein n=1 Tax=Aspergillus stella-maris TaxID=1810926 RepID=UPI003CCE228D